MKILLKIIVVFFFGLCNGAAQTVTNPGARSGHSLVYDEQLQKIVLLDGYTPPIQPEFTELWTWDGTKWQLLTASGPAGRTLSGAVYDSQRKRIISYGGLIGNFDVRSDTWEWNGQSWLLMIDTSAGSRDHHAMAYDQARGKTIMYGGATEIRALSNDTWEWDGVNWTKVATQGPGGLVHFAMTYDNLRHQIVLFGGLKNGQVYSNETWIWDGNSWFKASTEGPPPRARHRMAYDENKGVVILYGGDKGTTITSSGLTYELLQDMWQWDGHQWTEIITEGPGKRFMHAMAYDQEREKIVLYGGSDGEQELDDTWEWDGSQWSEKSGITGAESYENPESFFLEQNYPNPFNPETKITYKLPISSRLSIKIFDVIGTELASVVNGDIPAGTYEIIWNAVDKPGGVYFYRMQAGSFVQTRKMILIK